MKIDAHRSRNFAGLDEVTHGHTHPDHLPHGYFAMGMVQSFRDYLSKKYRKEIGLDITSADRTGYNDTVSNAADDSFHMWGDRTYLNKTYMCFALDMKSPDLTLTQLYMEAKNFFRGEVYINHQQMIVHVAPFGKDETFEIDKNGKTFNYKAGLAGG